MSTLISNRQLKNKVKKIHRRGAEFYIVNSSTGALLLRYSNYGRPRPRQLLLRCPTTYILVGVP